MYKFSSVPWLIGLYGDLGHEGQFSRDPLPVSSAGGLCEHGQGCPLSDVVHPAFPLPAMASPTIQGALKDRFGEAVMVSDMPEPCKFPSLDSCQKRLLRTNKEVDLALHPVIGLVLQVGDMEKFPHALGLENLDPLFSAGTNHCGNTLSLVVHQCVPSSIIYGKKPKISLSLSYCSFVLTALVMAWFQLRCRVWHVGISLQYQSGSCYLFILFSFF